MLALQLKFPWGRYYAHPWGINPVRLRDAEWPPSPWRLLRALASGWFRAHPGETPSQELRTLIEDLGRELPDIAIGPVAFSQTVHWQPNFGEADAEDKAAARYKRTRHENHSAATASPVIFRWDAVPLDDSLRPLLAEIVPHVTYFGRAESLCKLCLLGEEVPETANLGWCKPCVDTSSNAPLRRIAENCRDVFCADPGDFQVADLWSRRSGRAELNPNLAPPHLVDDLLSHQPLPDGARWVSYQMPEGWPGKWVVRVPRITRRKMITSSSQPRVAHYLRFSLQCRIPIPIKFTVPLAERFRAAAIGLFTKVSGNTATSFALSGHDKPSNVEGDHQHAFYLPLGANPGQPGLLNELHIWCPYGFTQSEIEALMRVQQLNWGGGDYPVRPVMVAIGDSIPEGSVIAAGQLSSRVWQSRTPFVPPRYFYRGNLHRAQLKVKDTPEHQLAQCLRQAGIATPGEIRRLAIGGGSQRSLPPLSAWDIVRAPEGEDSIAANVATAVHTPSDPGTRPDNIRRIGLFFEIEFDNPVALPLPALGHSSHFGLGLFLPERRE